jgi:hypothetical protein
MPQSNTAHTQPTQNAARPQPAHDDQAPASTGRPPIDKFHEDGEYNVVYTQQLEFTDFPLDEISLWFTNNTIYLPSEH